MNTCRLSVLWIATLAALASRTGAAAEPILIVDGGGAAVAVVSAACDPQPRAAAELLAQYIKESSGAELAVLPEDDPGAGAQPVTIHVGPDAYVKGLAAGLEKLDQDGFVIRGVDEKDRRHRRPDALRHGVRRLRVFGAATSVFAG